MTSVLKVTTGAGETHEVPFDEASTLQVVNGDTVFAVADVAAVELAKAKKAKEKE